MPEVDGYEAWKAGLRSNVLAEAERVEGMPPELVGPYLAAKIEEMRSSRVRQTIHEIAALCGGVVTGFFGHDVRGGL